MSKQVFVRWLTQELKNRNWNAEVLAARSGLDSQTVEAVLSQTQAPDFHFYYAVAMTMEKQAERLLHMAGLLSDVGLKVALKLARDEPISEREVYHARRHLPVEERRLILQCAQNRASQNPRYRLLRPAPHEYNKHERTQDRIRFSLLVLLLVLVLVGGSILCALLLA